ncbi:MAG: penicillin-binding transpeptidase domain-containing protein, partial [Oscillospiraceae bacterium]|nr:penicillin-binding transpeptidase domain-containing protein [Oscillospiraceae bacterium]
GVYWPTWYAVQKSHNTIAVRTLQKVGFKASYSMMTDKLGFTDLIDADINWSPLALGQFTYGARLHEVTAAYAVFGNGGVYYEPSLYDRVVDHNGKVILEQNLTGIQAIERDSAWITNRMLKKVVDDQNGSGRLAAISNIEVVGKTGTANDMRNLLFAGLSPEYVAVYSFGRDNSREVSIDYSVDGWRAPARVWGEIMSKVIDTSMPQSFTSDQTVLELPYCRETGLIANNQRCTSTELGFYRPSNVPHGCNATVHDGTGAAYWAIHGDPPDYRPQYF